VVRGEGDRHRGVFFRARDPEALGRWYAEQLGIEQSPTTYEGDVWWQELGPTVWAPFDAETLYFGSPDQAWMINFRVRDLGAIVSQLQAPPSRSTRSSIPTVGSLDLLIPNRTPSSCGSRGVGAPVTTWRPRSTSSSDTSSASTRASGRATSVDGHAHERGLDDAPPLQLPSQRFPLETGHARPEPDICGRRVLRLEAPHTLHGARDRKLGALKQ
jgi:hypothetical protein